MANVYDTLPADDAPSGHNVYDDLPGDDEAPAASAAPKVGWAEENIAGPSELIGGSIANIPHAAAHAGVNMFRRLTGGDATAPDPSWVQKIEVPQMAGARQLSADIPKVLGIGQGDSLQDAKLHADVNAQMGTFNNPLSESSRDTLRDVIEQGKDVASDVGALAPVASGATAAVRGASRLLRPPAPAQVTAISRIAGDAPALPAAGTGARQSMGAAQINPTPFTLTGQETGRGSPWFPQIKLAKNAGDVPPVAKSSYPLQ